MLARAKRLVRGGLGGVVAIAAVGCAGARGAGAAVEREADGALAAESARAARVVAPRELRPEMPMAGAHIRLSPAWAAAPGDSARAARVEGEVMHLTEGSGVRSQDSGVLGARPHDSATPAS